MAFIAICKVEFDTEEKAQRFVDKNTTLDVIWEIEEAPPPLVPFNN